MDLREDLQSVTAVMEEISDMSTNAWFAMMGT